MANRIVTDKHAALSREYADVLLPALRYKARQLGYAIGLHGSLRADIDLIAAPWTPEAVPAPELAEALRVVAEAIIGQAKCFDRLGADNPDYFDQGMPGHKPHGRLCWSFHLGGGPYIDLSVMPRHA